MNRKGGNFNIILILILLVVGFGYYNFFGGKEKIDDYKQRITCPSLNNITCDYGLDVYRDVNGCQRTRCIIKPINSNETYDTNLPEDGTLQIFFVDVGYGDGIYIETPDEKNIVLDTGKGDAFIDFLVMRGILSVDWVIQSHPDADHIGAMPELFDEFVVLNYLTPNISCSTVTCSELDIALSKEEDLNQYLGRTNFEFPEVWDITMEVLSPDDVIFNNDNDNSLVIRLDYGDLSVLFTGDCQEDCEEMLVLLDKPVQANILKVGHHASKTSTSARFLVDVNPAYAIISVGANPYGHPTKEIIERLIRFDITTLKTSDVGTIELRTDGTEIEWYCDGIYCET